MKEVMDEGGAQGVVFNWTLMGFDLVSAWGAEEDTKYKEVLTMQDAWFSGSNTDKETVYLVNPESKWYKNPESNWYLAAAGALAASSESLRRASSALRWPLGVPPPDTREYFVESRISPGGRRVKLGGEAVAEGAPRVTVMIATKRPGGMDAVLASLGRQTNRDFEVVIVDELWQREAEIRKRAQDFGVPLSVLTVSKPRSSQAAFGLQNAMNTGLSFARGAYVAITNDYTWVQPNFVQTILDFYESEDVTLPMCIRKGVECNPTPWDHAGNRQEWEWDLRFAALLSYPIVKFDAPQGFVNASALLDPTRVSAFVSDLTEPPSKWAVSDPMGPVDVK